MKVPVGCRPKIVPFYLKSIMGHKVVNSEVNAGKMSLKVIDKTPPLKWYTIELVCTVNIPEVALHTWSFG